MDFSNWASLPLDSKFAFTSIPDANDLRSFLTVPDLASASNSTSSEHALLTPVFSPYDLILNDPALNLNASPFSYTGTPLISSFSAQPLFDNFQPPLIPSLTGPKIGNEQKCHFPTLETASPNIHLLVPPKINHHPHLQIQTQAPSGSSVSMKRATKRKKFQEAPVSPDSPALSLPPRPHDSEDGEHRCPHPGCEKMFTRYYSLKSHLQCHSAVRPHVCQLCDSAFTRKHDLQRHMRTLHEEGRPYKCPKCKQGFRRATSYWRHLLEEQQEIKDPVQMAIFQQSVQAASGFSTNEFNMNTIQAVNRSIQPLIIMPSTYNGPNQIKPESYQIQNTLIPQNGFVGFNNSLYI